MLPVPNLDNRSFDQIMEEAKAYIPQLAPDWTDENAHDPGITLLELLAWHIEMQQYRINRMSVEFDRKFLMLLGGWPQDMKPSTTSISFTKVEEPTYIPFGTSFSVGELMFETTRAITVIPDVSSTVTLYHEGLKKEMNFQSGEVKAMFYPFGESGKIGAEMVIQLTTALPRCMPLSLWIELDKAEARVRIPARDKQFIPSAKVKWSYFEADEQGGTWLPIRLERDESYSFHQSGPILFELPLNMSEVKLIKAEVVEGKFDDVPRVRRILWNEVFASQGQTWCFQDVFAGWPEKDAEYGKHEAIQLILYHASYHKGKLLVQYRHKDGWLDVEQQFYEIEQDTTTSTLTIKPHDIVPIGEQSIRVVAIDPDFVSQYVIAATTGISHQRYPLPLTSLYEDELKLQIATTDESGKVIWYDWKRVLDFDHSSPKCRHYIIDDDAHIVFSDGVYGMIPSHSTVPNIRIIQYRTGEGVHGNVKEDTIRELKLGEKKFEVTNLFPATGGADKETIAEALNRVKLDILSPKCGVTEQDIERLVYSIPGIRVTRVKAIGGYHPKLTDYPNERALGHTSIVIVPQSKEKFPKPSKGLCQTIASYIEPYRLITTKFHIVEPEYILVTVRAIIVVHPHYEGREHEVVTALNKWLSPTDTHSTMGWEFGRSISKSDVYDYIHTVAGVHYIQDLWIMAEGKQVVQDEGGDLRIPPNGLAYSGTHDIEFIINEGG